MNQLKKMGVQIHDPAVCRKAFQVWGITIFNRTLNRFDHQSLKQVSRMCMVIIYIYIALGLRYIYIYSRKRHAFFSFYELINSQLAKLERRSSLYVEMVVKHEDVQFFLCMCMRQIATSGVSEKQEIVVAGLLENLEITPGLKR